MKVTSRRAAALAAALALGGGHHAAVAADTIDPQAPGNPVRPATAAAPASPVAPASTATSVAGAPADTVARDLGSIDVTAKRLDEARQTLAPDLGADTFNFTRQDIQRLPAGESTPLNQVLLQAPGVVQDSFGQIHVRGDHGDLQYRVNDVIIPESIGGFGQTLQTRFADNLRLITGALPAQYGYRTAGVVDITTRDGAYDSGGMLGVMGGSHDTLQFYGDASGSSGDFTYYVLGSWMQNGLGIESPTPSANPLHDDTTQGNGFAYLSYHIGGDTRLSLIGGSATNRFQIPNVPGQTPQFTLAGAPDLPSADLNQNQVERTTYVALALQGSIGPRIDYQVAPFYRYTGVDYNPARRRACRRTWRGAWTRRTRCAAGSTSRASASPPTTRRRCSRPTRMASRRATCRSRSSTTQAAARGSSACTCRTNGGR